MAGIFLAASAPAISLRGRESANETIRVGVMGLGRGTAHVNATLDIPNADVAYVCDVDQRRVNASLNALKKRGKTQVQGVRDFHRILEDPSVDALMIATCNHWHAPATILGCSAGKHVYVEKPGSHNPREGEWMVAAARKHNRIVQMGNQRRSWPGIIEAIEKLHAGAIGHLTFSRCFYTNARPSIGHGKRVPVPDYLDFNLWQGPAPERPYKDNLVHYNWHWHWHWGNGELGNNGIHALDLARWGLGVDLPQRIAYVGGRYHYDDDQETPDSGTAVYDFGSCGASWEHGSCHPRRQEDLSFVSFYGTQGTLEIRGGGYTIFNLDGKETDRGSGPGGDRDHIANFFDSIRTGTPPHSEIENGQISTLLCHLGNIAYRTGSTLHFDPQQRRIIGNSEADSLWTRNYRPGWKPEV